MTTPEQLAETRRVFDRVSVGGADECWQWLGAPNSRGYGSIRIEGRTKKAHRVVYEAVRGEIPDGHLLHHTCEDKLCVNPRHLVPVTSAQHHAEHGNKAARAIADKIHARTHCIRGHEFSPENTRIDSRGWRVCKSCANKWNREWQRRR